LNKKNKGIADVATLVRDTIRMHVGIPIAMQMIAAGSNYLMAALTGDDKKKKADFWRLVSGTIDRSYGGWLIGRDVVYELKRAVEMNLIGKPQFLNQPRGHMGESIVGELYNIVVKNLFNVAWKSIIQKKNVKPHEWNQLALSLLRGVTYLGGGPGLLLEKLARPSLTEAKKSKR
jgi:hypothetical protein